MKRIVTFLLVIALSVGLIPSVTHAEGKQTDETPFEVRHPQAIDVWEKIEQIEDQTAAKKNATIADAAKAAYAIVEASETTLPGSIERHGEAFFWRTVDGAACGYNPGLRERIRRSEAGTSVELAGSTSEITVQGGVASSKNVAVFQPYIGLDSSFTDQYATEGKSIAKALGGVCSVYTISNATIDNIAKALQTCAVVIFDSHGDTDYWNGDDCVSRANTSYLCLQSDVGITSEDMKTVSGTYGTYQHAYYAGSNGVMKYYCVDGTAIANHMTQNAPKSLLWMAICLGMATDGLHKPLRGKGVQTVYGYSQSVSFDGDYEYEESFFYAMKLGATVRSAISLMKRERGNWDPAYKNYSQSMAIRNYVAFPIVVSAEDTYPGQGKVDAVQTVVGKGQIKNLTFLYGDVNGDGTVTSMDASLLLRSFVKLATLTRDQLLRADVRTDCAVNASDASEILRRIVQLKSKFDAEP